MYSNNYSIIGIGIIIGIIYLIYKVFDFRNQRNALQRKLDDNANFLDKTAGDLKRIHNLTNQSFINLYERQHDAYSTMLSNYKVTTSKMPIAYRKKIAHKIARNCVDSVLRNPVNNIETDNDKKITYYSVIFPGIENSIAGFNADIDAKELVSAIEQFILKNYK